MEAGSYLTTSARVYSRQSTHLTTTAWHCDGQSNWQLTHTHIYIPVKITVLSSLFFNMIKGPCPSTGTKYACTFMLEGFGPPERTCSKQHTYMLLEGTRVFDVSQLHGLFRCQNQCAMELWLPIFILKRQCSPITWKFALWRLPRMAHRFWDEVFESRWWHPSTQYLSTIDPPSMSLPNKMRYNCLPSKMGS